MSALKTLIAHWTWEGTDRPCGAQQATKARDGARRAAYRAAAEQLQELTRQGEPSPEQLLRLVEEWQRPRASATGAERLEQEAVLGTAIGLAAAAADLDWLVARHGA